MTRTREDLERGWENKRGKFHNGGRGGGRERKRLFVGVRVNRSGGPVGGKRGDPGYVDYKGGVH